MKAAPQPLPDNPATLVEVEFEVDVEPGAGADGAAVSCGSDTDFERFLREHHEALLNYLRQHTATEEDAQDAAQESLIRLMRYRHAQTAGNWKALMYRIATNVACDQARTARARQRDAHMPLDDNVRALPSAELPQEDWMAHQQALARTREAILGLPRRCQQIYLLNRIEGMSYAQIARHCGITVKAVEKQITKALSLLRQRLGEVADATA